MKRLIAFKVIIWSAIAFGQQERRPLWWGDDLQGSYCAARPEGSQCCTSRLDNCSVPIIGSTCYCDQFCRSRANDCCPDYDEVCLGITKPSVVRKCYLDGNYYNEGDYVKLNCKSCLCQRDGNLMNLFCTGPECIVEDDVIKRINSEKKGWTAGRVEKFMGESLEKGFKWRLGTNSYRRKVAKMFPKTIAVDKSRIKREFDSRLHWPGKISPAADQGWCGASWAFSTVGVASDRWAVMGSLNEPLSTQHLFSCLRSLKGNPCEGGQITRAWTFIKKYGLVTEKCLPWHGSSRCEKFMEKARFRSAKTAVCPSGETIRLRRMMPVYRINSTEDDIMFEIATNGPVQAVMDVSRDFFLYQNGVFSCPERRKQKFGFHSVRIIGWGEENGRKYWIVMNSWGPEWGEDGTFKIIRGQNECNIESFVLAAWTTPPLRK